MKINTLILRCYAKYDEGQWIAFCLDFDLAAQADTFEQAKTKLENMIKEYVFDALVGEDKEYAEQLLTRNPMTVNGVNRFIHARCYLDIDRF